jgi:hypothetical protein
MDDADVKEYLARNDDDFRLLLEQHQAYERELQEFVNKPYLNPAEQVKETEIKKRKLILKDQMQVRITQYQSQHATG